MSRRQLHREIARHTGESLHVIRRLGFQVCTVPAAAAERPARHRTRPHQPRHTPLLPR